MRRRTRGEGGLYQRHDHPTCPPVGDDGERPDHKCQGRWIGTLVVIAPDGRKRRKSVYGRTKAEARNKLARATREKEDGTLVLRTVTVKAWMEHWLDAIAPRSLRPQTLKGYKSKTALYIVPHLGHHRLTSLRPEHIRGMHDLMREADLSEATIRQTHAILKRSLRVAVHERKLAINPADQMDSPGTETEKRIGLTVDQARHLLAAAGDDPRWWLALLYGMRQGEVLGLRWCDVDFDAHTIRIEQSLQLDLENNIIFGPPKSKASKRPLPLLPVVEARLRLLHHDQGEPPHDSRLIFTNDGEPWKPWQDWRRWRDLLDSAGLPHIALHAARNTAASLMEAVRVPDRLAAQILGQSQVTTTHGYQHAEMARELAALSQVADMLELE